MANIRRLKTAKEPLHTEMPLRDVYEEFKRDQTTHYRFAGSLGDIYLKDNPLTLVVKDHILSEVVKPDPERDCYRVTVTIKTPSNTFPILFGNGDWLDFKTFEFTCLGSANCIRTENDLSW